MPKRTDSAEVMQFQIKRHHFFAAFIPVAFIVGVAVGYLMWGQGAAALVPASEAQANSELGAVPTSIATQPGDIVAQRYDIPIDEDDPVLGAEDAPITIVEFADFQCPYCLRHAQETTPQLVAAYGDQIRFVYKDFPLISIHPEAYPSALAAQCALEQDMFWEYHDLLFNGGLELGAATYTTYAEQLGLDMTQFNACVGEERYADRVQADYNFASQLGVSSTPTFFINGIAVIGAQPFSVFAEIIDYELENQ